MNTRKPQSNSALGKLTAEQEERLESWLFEENRGYTEVRALLKAEFGIETSRAALCRYYQRWLAPKLITADRDELAAWRGVDTEGFDEAVVARARQLSFDALMSREPDVKLAERTMGIVNRVERRRLAGERAALDERRMDSSGSETLAVDREWEGEVEERLDAGTSRLDVRVGREGRRRGDNGTARRRESGGVSPLYST